MTKKQLGGIFILLAVIVALASCGGSNPKALAKQTYDLGIQAIEAAFDSEKTAEINKKSQALEAKINALSASDRAKYDRELALLSLRGLGNIMKSAGGKINEAAGLITDEAVKALDLSQDQYNEINEAAGILSNEAAKALGGVSQEALNEARAQIKEGLASDEFKDAMKESSDALKAAADALKGLGF